MRDTDRSYDYRRQRKTTMPNEARDDLESKPLESHFPGRARKRRGAVAEGGVRQCDSCGCSVPLSGWEVHINGIRHRRNLASVTLMGEPGHLVRSIFEQDPTHIPDTYRGKDPIAHRAQELRQPAGQYSGGEDGMLQQFPNPAGSQNPNPHRSHQLGGHRTMGGPFPGATHPQHQGPHHRRPHSVAFAELQARREQRLLGAIGAPFRFPREPSDSDPSPSSGSSDSDAGADANIPRGRSQPGIWAGPGFGEGRLLEAAAWVPDNADIDALVAAARREAVHHTGLGPLYQAALGLLGADSLRNGARELQDRLGRYRLRMDSWQRRQQHLCQAQDLKNNSSSGNSGDDSSGGSSGAEEGKMRRLRMRPYLRLGPTELLLLSIHPSVAVKESSGCKTATGLGVSMAIGSTLSNAVSDPICSGAKSSRQRDVAIVAVHAPGRTALGNSPLRVPRSEAGRQERGRQQHSEKRKFQQGKKWQQIANALGSGDGGIAGSGPPWPQPQQSAATAAMTSTAPSLSPSPLRHLYLEVPFKPYGREAAAYATAMGVLLAALRRAEGSCLEAFGFRFSREEYLEVLAQGGPARVGPLEGLWQLVPPLVQLLQARPGLLAEMRLSCPPGLLDAEQVECLQRATVDRQIGNQRRLAVLMGTHRRLGSSSLLRNLPPEVLELVLDAALPRRPCRLVLGMSKWLPGQRQRGSRPRQGAALEAAAGAVPFAAGPAAGAPQQQEGPGLDPAAAVAHQQQQQQLLPRDVREAMRHAAWH